MYSLNLGSAAGWPESGELQLHRLALDVFAHAAYMDAAANIRDAGEGLDGESKVEA